MTPIELRIKDFDPKKGCLCQFSKKMGNGTRTSFRFIRGNEFQVRVIASRYGFVNVHAG